jgi:hypothetical protein
VSEIRKCKCVNANLNSLVAVEEATMWVVCCDECGRHGPWSETEQAAWASWNSDRLAEEKAREAMNLVRPFFSGTIHEGGTVRIEIPRSKHDEIREALALLKEE